MRADLGRDVVVLARQQLRRALDHRDLRAEAPVHLRELQADVAAADDHQVLGHAVHGPSSCELVRNGTSFTPGMSGHRRPAADVEEHLVGLERAAVHAQRRGAVKRAWPRAASRSSCRRSSRRGRRDDCFTTPSLRAFTAPHVDATSPAEKPYSAPRRATWIARALADQRLGGNAADVDAGAAEELALDERGLQAFGVQPRGERGTGLPRTDDDGIVAFAQQLIMAQSSA